MDKATEYMKLKAAADKATDAWLENDSAENFAAMVAADDARIAAEAAGWHIVKLNDAALEGIMERSVFGDADRSRAAKVQAAQENLPKGSGLLGATVRQMIIEHRMDNA